MTTDMLAPARHVIGSRYVDSVQPYLLDLTGLAVARVVRGPDRFDYSAQQVRIDVDENGIIVNLRNC
ncbi:hypothetical protein D3C76_996790 [compost metagenome]